jgi:phage gp29-like protein
MALGKVHLEILWQIIKADAIDLEQVINDQLIAPWLQWTFGLRGLDRDVRPTWVIDKEPPTDLEAVALLLKDARALGMEIPTVWAREKLGIPVPEEGDEVLAAPVVPGDLIDANLQVNDDESEPN